MGKTIILTRHLKNHKNEDSVKSGIRGDEKEKRAAFRCLKHNGILKHNTRTAGRKGVVVQHERLSRSGGRTVVCDGCSRIFHRHWYLSQRKRCHAEQSMQPKPVFYSSFKVEENFKKDVLSHSGGRTVVCDGCS